MSPNKKLKIFISGPYAWWRLSTFVMFGLMAASIIYSGFFVYNYTFQSLEDAHTIVLLNTDSIVNTINVDNYSKAVNILNIKQNTTTIPVDLRNIFSYDIRTSTAYATPNKPTSTPTSTPR